MIDQGHLILTWNIMPFLHCGEIQIFKKKSIPILDYLHYTDDRESKNFTFWYKNKDESSILILPSMFISCK